MQCEGLDNSANTQVKRGEFLDDPKRPDESDKNSFR